MNYCIIDIDHKLSFISYLTIIAHIASVFPYVHAIHIAKFIFDSQHIILFVKVIEFKFKKSLFTFIMNSKYHWFSVKKYIKLIKSRYKQYTT